MSRLTAVTVSVIAGIVAAAVSAKLIDTWTWPLGIALGVSTVALIVTQLWLSKDGDGRSGTGHVDVNITNLTKVIEKESYPGLSVEPPAGRLPGHLRGREEICAGIATLIDSYAKTGLRRRRSCSAALAGSESPP